MFAYMFTHPGTKLLFMGGEFGQRSEWNHDAELDWSVLETESHLGIQNLVRDLNKLYRDERALYRFNFQPEGFQWVDTMDYENSVISWLRHSDKADESLLIIGNFTPRVLPDYVVGVPSAGKWNVAQFRRCKILGKRRAGRKGCSGRKDPSPWTASFHSRYLASAGHYCDSQSTIAYSIAVCVKFKVAFCLAAGHQA
jgi:1,4-alpha-glucan branching enzyme